MPMQIKCDFSFEAVPYSDHKLIIGEVHSAPGMNSTITGKSYWKLNTAVLEEEEYQNRISKKIDQASTLKPLYENVDLWWDALKIKLKEETIDYCRKRGRKKKRSS